jgi:hypothetical protein
MVAKIIVLKEEFVLAMELYFQNAHILVVIMSEEKMGFVDIIILPIRSVSIVNSIKFKKMEICAQHVLDTDRILKSSS